MKPYLSLCMIVKNEESVIERCLSSISHLVDEIIIVDTGSTDNTKEKVKAFTSNIHDFEWVNDFSAARNFAASKASGEWILVLDADEFIDEENFNGFIQELQNDDGSFDTYTAKILNFTGNSGENLVQNFHDRIYKNNGKIQYYRKIHEQFESRDGQTLRNKNSSLLIFHSGYLNYTVQEKDKKQRNKELLDKEINNGENKAFDYFNFGNEYFSIGEYLKALDSYLEAYKLKKDFRLSWVSTTLVQMIICLINLKRYNDALNVIRDAESIYAHSPEIQYLKGEIFFLRGQFEDAKETFLHITNNQDLFHHIILRPDLKELRPHIQLGEIYLYQKDYSSAIFHFTSVLNIDKYNKESIKQVIYILSKFHTVDEITNFLFLRELVNGKNIKSYIKTCFLFGLPDLAISLLEKDQQNNQILYKIALLKQICIQGKGNIKEIYELLDYEIMKDLIKSNWINLIDIYLLKEIFNKDSKVISLCENFKIEDHYKTLLNIFQDQNLKEFIPENFFLFTLQTLITYKKEVHYELLLNNIDNIDKNSIRKVATLLFSYDYKVKALQLYESADWDTLKEQDFINIVISLLQINNLDHAMEICKYALSIFDEDFRFYELILKNTQDPDLFNSTLKKASGIFFNSAFLNRLT
jgi:glycosyltransferase involved in cell wall biosynthesis